MALQNGTPITWTSPTGSGGAGGSVCGECGAHILGDKLAAHQSWHLAIDARITAGGG